MKVLILGSKGNLGSQLVKLFDKDKNYKIIAWDKEEIDITDKELIAKKINDTKPDIIINAVAYNAVDKCENNEQEFAFAKKINGEAIGYLAESAIKNNSTLTHYSTDYVFDGKNKKGYQENNKPNPINNYGKSKLIGEKEIIKKSAEGLKWYLIRTSKLFGPKAVSDLAKPNFFDSILNLSKKNKKLKIVNEENSCFTYTPDLADATKKLIESKKPWGIYHLTNSNHATWYDAAKFFFETIKNKKINITPVSSNEFARPAKRPKHSILLNTKFIHLRNWKQALKEYIKNYH